MMFDLQKLVRPNIWGLEPYSSARADFEGSAEIFLDANENAFGSPSGFGLNRYPDPLQTKLKDRIAEMKGISPSQVFVANGSDEAIDLLFRIFCEPGSSEVIICPPTYGMYRVLADLNDVTVREVRLTSDYQPDVDAILTTTSDATKLIFICSPNNPTGNLMNRRSILQLAQQFKGVVVVDEAYIDFADEPSLIAELSSFPNLVILQTFSKAWGMASVRVGIALASREIINLMSRVKLPYNVSGIAQQAVFGALDCESKVREWIGIIKDERSRLGKLLAKLAIVKKVYPSDSNFLLVKFDDAPATYRYLIGEKIVVRNRSNIELCEGCLRITIGTIEENTAVYRALRKLTNKIGSKPLATDGSELLKKSL